MGEIANSDCEIVYVMPFILYVCLLLVPEKMESVERTQPFSKD